MVVLEGRICEGIASDDLTACWLRHSQVTFHFRNLAGLMSSTLDNPGCAYALYQKTPGLSHFCQILSHAVHVEASFSPSC